MRSAPGQFLFINLEFFGQHSVDIDAAFVTKSDIPTYTLGVLVQANTHHPGWCKVFRA